MSYADPLKTLDPELFIITNEYIFLKLTVFTSFFWLIGTFFFLKSQNFYSTWRDLLLHMDNQKNL